VPVPQLSSHGSSIRVGSSQAASCSRNDSGPPARYLGSGGESYDRRDILIFPGGCGSAPAAGRLNSGPGRFLNSMAVVLENFCNFEARNSPATHIRNDSVDLMYAPIPDAEKSFFTTVILQRLSGVFLSRQARLRVWIFIQDCLVYLSNLHRNPSHPIDNHVSAAGKFWCNALRRQYDASFHGSHPVMNNKPDLEHILQSTNELICLAHILLNKPVKFEFISALSTTAPIDDEYLDTAPEKLIAQYFVARLNGRSRFVVVGTKSETHRYTSYAFEDCVGDTAVFRNQLKHLGRGGNLEIVQVIRGGMPLFSFSQPSQESRVSSGFSLPRLVLDRCASFVASLSRFGNFFLQIQNHKSSGGPEPTQDIATFFLSEEEEEDNLARQLFSTLIRSQEGPGHETLTVSALRNAAARSTSDIERNLLTALHMTLSEADVNITFELFNKAFRTVPRLRAEKLRWAAGLRIHAILARLLPMGDAFDGLRGLRKLDPIEMDNLIQNSITRLTRELQVVLRKGIIDLQQQTDGSAKVEEFCNSKFMTDVSLGRFATLDDFYKGPEHIFGSPNPRIYEAIEKEHCTRDNAQRRFTSTNYNVETFPQQEWELVVCPKAGSSYPHTQQDFAQWESGKKLRGNCGRNVVAVDELLEKPEVKDKVELAGLKREEVICLRLYSGPMYVLYNAALRGIPERDVAYLGSNRYETTIFVITSGITKLSKVTMVPTGRVLYRGLSGRMALPESFWRNLYKNKFVISVTAGRLAQTVMRELQTRMTPIDSASVAASSGIGIFTGLLEFAVRVRHTDETRLARVEATVACIATMVRVAATLPPSRGGPEQETLDGLTSAIRTCCSDVVSAAGQQGELKITFESTDKFPEFRGGVELGLLSLSASRETAMWYGRSEYGRHGTLFEVQVGRVDIGASIQFLSQYPGEDEFLMPPLSCLEVVGEPRLDCDASGMSVVVFPLRVNVNLKSHAIEDLIGRRKRLHTAATKNLREELMRSTEERAERLGRLLGQRRYGAMELLHGHKDNVELLPPQPGYGWCEAHFNGRHWTSTYASYLMLSSGQSFFEIEVIEAVGTLGAGFAGTRYTCDTTSDSKSDIGDDSRSWAIFSFDKARHAGQAKKFPEAGEGWFVPGAVLGLAIDFESGKLLAAIGHPRKHGQNLESGTEEGCGSCWEVVYDSGVKPGFEVGGALFPVLTGGWGAKVKYNFGNGPMRHTPPGPGYKSVFASAIAERSGLSVSGLQSSLTNIVAGDDESTDASVIGEAEVILGSINVSQSVLLKYFDEVRERHEALAPEDYNDDAVYKTSLDEILAAKVSAERKQEAVVELLEAGVSESLLEPIRSAPAKEFQDASAATLRAECPNYSWLLVFSGWFRFVETVEMPLNSAPCLIALIWRAVLDAAAHSSGQGSPSPSISVGANSNNKRRIQISELLPALDLSQLGLHSEAFQNMLLGLVQAATECDRIPSPTDDMTADIRRKFVGNFLLLTEADFRDVKFSAERTLDLARVVVQGRVHGSLRSINKLQVKEPVGSQNLRFCVNRTLEEERDKTLNSDRVNHMHEDSLLGERLCPVDWGFVTAEAACGKWQSLNISCNGLGPEGATGLSVGLGWVTSLTTLDLSSNNIGPSGAMTAGAALTSLAGLTHLNLAQNVIAASGAAAIAGGLRRLSKLAALNLAENELLDAGATSICDAISALVTLSYLDMAKNMMQNTGGEAVASLLMGHSMLTVVDLSEQDVGDAVWTIVSAVCPRISTLRVASGVISMMPIEDMSIRAHEHSGHHQQNDWKSKVGLSKTRLLGCTGAKEIANILRSVHAAKALTALELANNGIGGDGASWLGPALLDLSHLTKLDLTSNSLGAQGAVAIAKGLNGLISLRSLSLRENNIGSAGWRFIAKAAKELTALESLNGFDDYRIVRDGVAEVLEVSGKEVAAAISDLLPKSRNTLRKLDFSANCLEIFLSIDHIPSTYLGQGLESCSDLLDEAHATAATCLILKDLHVLFALTTLKLCDNKLGTAGGIALGKALESLIRLDLLDVSRTELRPAGATAIASGLSNLTGLRVLCLAGNRVQGEGVQAVCDTLPNPAALTYLDLGESSLGHQGAATLSQRLSRLSNLEILKIPENDFGGDGGYELGKGLQNLLHVAELDLRCNALGCQGGESIFEGLAMASLKAGSASLKKIDLRDNMLGKEGGIAIAKSMSALTALEELSIAANDLGCDGGPAIVDALINHPLLRQIDMGDNKLTYVGGKKIGFGLGKLVGLRTLYLEGNELGADGVEALVLGLSSLTGLRTLDLRENALGPDGGAALGRWLSCLTSLETLDLDSNNLGSSGGEMVARGVSLLSCLKVLDMRDNALGNSCSKVKALIDTGSNKGVQLDLGWNDIVRKSSSMVSSSIVDSGLHDTNLLATLRKRSSLRARHMTIRGCLLKLGRGKAYESAVIWRERLCFISNGRLYYESAKKKGEAEMVADLADIISVRPYDDNSHPGHYMFSVEVAGGAHLAMTFSANSARERARWITALTRKHRETTQSHTSASTFT
jgi:Ran GTPase-activating protein (RanGAP) involved in mRNA processing and transport